MTKQVEKWGCFEAAYTAEAQGNPFDVEFLAEFSLGSFSQKVSGFYDGEATFKVRFMPHLEGEWRCRTYSDQAQLSGKASSFRCVAPAKDNHGPVRVVNTIRFAYADGTPYIPVGTTCYVWNLQGDALEEETLQTLSQAPFNKIRMCLFPKRYTYNQNEPPCYPFPVGTGPERWDFARFNPAYFQHIEKRILDLQALGIEADLILFHPYDNSAWGFDQMPPEVNDRCLRYLVARLGAIRNLWWSFANEYDILADRSMEDWDHYFQLVQQVDPYDHLRSIHNCMSFYNHSQPWVSHCSIQSSNITRVPLWLQKYGKPVVIDECCYEGDIPMMWGDLSPEELVLRFWVGFTLGGYVGHGETYENPEEILWWSKGGRLRGQSASRIGFLRQVFEQAPAAGLTPIEKVDNETVNLLEKSSPDEIFRSQPGDVDRIIAEGRWNVEAGGHCGSDYFLFYFGMHAPSSRNFNLPPGTFRVDVIDTWEMTLETALENASGAIQVKLPGKKFMAIRIQRLN